MTGAASEFHVYLDSTDHISPSWLGVTAPTLLRMERGAEPTLERIACL